jgi:hypothetical protein
MTLSFYPRGGAPVRIPGAIQIVGEPAMYVGRTKAAIDGGRFAYPADGRPFRCKPGSATAQRLMKLLRRDQALWPADKETAEHCGVEFVPVSLVDGEWVPSRSKKTTPPKGGFSQEE